MAQNDQIKRENLLDEVQAAIKDIFVATVRKREDEIIIRFPNGQQFTLALWENIKK